MGDDGTPLSMDEYLVRRKFIDFREVDFPEINPIEMVVPAYKARGEVRLASYRYPADPTGPRKGIVQWIHGFGDYSGRYGYLAKQLSEAGYDVVAIDQRGFGNSEGTRGYITEEMARDDLINFTEKVVEKYGGADVPLFTIGHSLGGALSMIIACERPDLISGITMITPLVALHPKH